MSGYLIIVVIACKPQYPSYLHALLPTDQVFDLEEYQFEPRPVKKKKVEIKDKEEGKLNCYTYVTHVKFAIPWILIYNVLRIHPVSETKTQNENTDQNEEITAQQDVIDNPYLRPVKIPKTMVVDA